MTEVGQHRSVLTPHRAPHKLFGRLNQIEDIVLAPAGQGPTGMHVDVGCVFMGRGRGAQPTPAICHLDDRPRRVKPNAQHDLTLSRLGCRE